MTVFYFIYKIYMKKFLSGIALWALGFLIVWNVLVSAQEVEEEIVNPTDAVESIESVDVETVEPADEIVAEVEDPINEEEDTLVYEDDAVLWDENFDVDSDYNWEDDEEMQEFLNMFNDIEDPEERGMAKGVVGGLLGGFAIIYIVVAIIWVVLAIIALWKIFVRAWEKGWKAIIPIYNVYIMYKIVGMKNWFWYSILVPVVLWIVAALLEKSSPDATPILSAIWSVFSGIVGIVASFKLPRKFGWGVGTSVLYVLFTAICLLILGFGNYEYNKED